MNERYDVPDINKQLIWNLWDISHTMRQISEGKGSQKRILCMLKETGPITQSELTQWLGIQPGSASEVLGKLGEAGLIVREQSQEDRRTTRVHLTEKGKQEAEIAFAARKERQKQMFENLSDEEKRIFLEILEKVNADWDEKYRENAPCGIHRMWFRKKEMEIEERR